MIVGLDGCKGDWIGAIDRGQQEIELRHFKTLSDVIDYENLSLAIIDIPIGLMPRGPRACDVLARQVLGKSRRSSVFPAPIRLMLAANNWGEACSIRFEIEGKKCSKQTWAIVEKIVAVDLIMTPILQRRVREGHPEVSFATMNNGAPMVYRKNTSAGREERLHLLTRYFPDPRENLSAFRVVPGVSSDAIDAYACLWTARRVLHGEAIHYPVHEQTDEKGLRAEIVGLERRAEERATRGIQIFPIDRSRQTLQIPC